MIEFEWYINRARINLDLLFEMNGIKSDEDLKNYCDSKGFSHPKKKYFEKVAEVPVVEEVKVEVPLPSKPRKTRRKTTTKAKTATPAATQVKKTEEKPAPRTRRRTRKKATDKK